MSANDRQPATPCCPEPHPGETQVGTEPRMTKESRASSDCSEGATAPSNPPPAKKTKEYVNENTEEQLNNLISPHVGSSLNTKSKNSVQSPPWTKPRVLTAEREKALFSSLHKRLAKVPTRSGQRRQKLYIDLWSGQHWLGLVLSGAERTSMLIPVSNDTAVSVAMTGSYRVLNPTAFATASH